MTTTRTERLALTQIIEDQSEALVELAEAVFSPQVMQKLAELKRGTFMSQLNNLAGVARETESAAVVRNWIQYQMGRQETRPPWQETGFGAAVLKGLEKVKELAKGAATEAAPVSRIEIALVRRYAGYLVRWYVAKGGQQ